MKIGKLALIGILIGFVAVLSIYVANRPPTGRSQTSNRSEDHHMLTNFNSDLVKNRKIEALGGSKQAAAWLAKAYSDCAALYAYGQDPKGVPGKSICENEMRFWFQVAAENGEVGAIALKIDNLLKDKSCYGAYRASFWLAKVKDSPEASTLAWRKDETSKAQQTCKW